MDPLEQAILAALSHGPVTGFDLVNLFPNKGTEVFNGALHRLLTQRRITVDRIGEPLGKWSLTTMNPLKPPNEWEVLGSKYPSENDPSAQAAFDVLAPFKPEHNRRWPLFEHATGTPSVKSVWNLATKIAHAVLKTRKMNLPEYLQQQRELLERFEAHWKQGQKDEPTHFPDALDEPEWDEQLLAFSNAPGT